MPPQGLPGQGLPGYGLLIGKIIGARLQRSGSPHLLLFVQPGNADHPTYRVAVNLQSTDRHHVSDLQYQVVDFGSRSTLSRGSKGVAGHRVNNQDGDQKKRNG